MVFDVLIKYPIAFSLTVMAISLLILLKAADLLIKGSAGFAKKFGLSDYITGFFIIGIGTSLPEFIAAIMGSALEDPGVIFGTVLGSAVVTVTLVLGIEAFVARTMPVETKILGWSKYLVPFLMALPIFLVLDGRLGRIDGIILLLTFAAYLYILWQKESLGNLKDVKLKFVWKDMFVYLGAFAALLLGARFLVSSAIITSSLLEIPSYLIALFVIGIGASVGDLMVDLSSIRSGHAKVAIGDVLSGLVVEMLFILGFIALLKPVAIDPKPLLLSTGFAVIPLALLLFFVKKAITRAHGIMLIALFVIFSVIQVWLLV